MVRYSKGKIVPGGTSGSVVLQRVGDNSYGMVFIVSADTMELIYDGRCGFEINHKRLTVNQVNPQTLNANRIIRLIIPELLLGFNTERGLDSGYVQSQNDSGWIVQFKVGRSGIRKLWINKRTMRPEKLLFELSSFEAVLLSIRNVQANKGNISRPSERIVRYIDSYTLLPLSDPGIQSEKDSRDSLIGKQALDFNLLDISGKRVSLSDFKGRYVLLAFWEAWCGPCRMSMPHLEELHRKFHEKGLEIIGLTKDNSILVRKLINDKQVTYLNVVSSDNVIREYNVFSIPQYYLISPNGIIIYVSKNGFEQKIEDIIRKALE